jgi:hypothetical protein
MSEDGAYRTDDMALATMLALAGFAYQLTKITEHKAIWIFTATESRQEEMDDLIDDYAEFKGKVEPRAFVTRWGELRRELFMIVPPPHRRRPAAPATT